jgi:hypothetical protein
MSAGSAKTSGRAAKVPPEKKIGPFANGVGATVWLNRIDSDQGVRHIRSITINPRRYFDRDTNEWRDAPSYNPADLPALIFALSKAQEYCYETPLPGSPPENSDPLAAAQPSEDIPF